MYLMKNHDGEGKRKVLGYNGYDSQLGRSSITMCFD